MSVEDNLRVVDHAIEEFNVRNWDRFGEFHAESVVLTAPNLPEPAKGRAGVREWAKDLATAFPDIRWETVQSFGQDNWVSAEIIATGTHKGPLPGPNGTMIPATNKAFRMPISVVFKVEGDTVAVVNVYNDLFGMMVQLGLAA